MCLPKSSFFFSKQVLEVVWTELVDKLRMLISKGKRKFLRLPYLIGQNYKKIFLYLRERILEKITGWKEKLLSQAGKKILIKFVLQAIRSYVMSVFLLPNFLCDEITDVIQQIWWSSEEKERGICWKSGRICVKVNWKGGLGFRNFEVFNFFLFAKQGSRLLHNPESILSRCLQAIYLPSSDFMQAQLGNRPSFEW